jgi:hypothetical protein
MKKIILRTIIYCSVTIIVLYIIMVTVGKVASFEVQEVLGYASMVIALLFTFFGIKQYRDEVNHGSLSFGEGMKTGLLITLIPAVLFAAIDGIYTRLINPDWYKQYYAAYLAKLKASMPPSDFAIQAKEMEKEQAFFNNPAVSFAVMFLTVFLIGIIVTVISALLLRRRKVQA